MEQTGQPHTLTGDIRSHSRMRSRILRRMRDVLVYLPPGYDKQSHRRFPVLYVQDGRNVFDGATSFVPGQEWELDETAERLIRAGEIEPLIIVAVDHAGRRRLDEYAPSYDARRGGGGQADLYGRMLIEELKPFIDRTYRTLRGPGDTGLAGSSMGGLVTLHLGMTRPDVFGRLAVMSPSLWWDNRAIVRRAERTEGRLALRIWLDVGLEEGNAAVRDVRALKNVLLGQGWVAGHDLAYLEAPGAGHSERAWAARVPDVLRFLYPPPQTHTTAPGRARAADQVTG
jgi:predicted alpha/beta superfamily hydrolase